MFWAYILNSLIKLYFLNRFVFEILIKMEECEWHQNFKKINKCLIFDKKKCFLPRLSPVWDLNLIKRTKKNN